MNFFKTLKSKTEKSPSLRAEQELFRKLDQEWNPEETKVLKQFWMHWEIWLRPIPTVFAVLALAIGINQIDRTSPGLENGMGTFAALDSIERELLMSSDDLEFYETLEDWMLTASEEEWKKKMETTHDQSS